MRRLVLMFAIAVIGCGDGEDVDVRVLLPDIAELRCSTAVPTNLGATLFISGNIEPCKLTIDGNGAATGTCSGIPTGIVRYLVLRYDVPGPPNGALPLRYAITQADLTPQTLRHSRGTVPIVFNDDGVHGMYVESDADIAELATLLYGPPIGLSGAICFARSLIAADAGTNEVATDCRAETNIAEILDLDGDSCTNLVELCDGTSPTDGGSASCN